MHDFHKNLKMFAIRKTLKIFSCQDNQSFTERIKHAALNFKRSKIL